MIINSEQKWLFIHVPKTAGTSLRRSLVGGKPVKPKHQYIRNVQYDDWFTFAFVRNPWERLLSLHVYASERNLIKQKDFKSWLLGEGWWEEEELSYCRQSDRSPHQRRPMSDWLTDDAGEVVVDFIGKFENLQNDITTLREQHNINIAPLPHINRTNHLQYRGVYDAEMKEFVSQYHQMDITRFEYNF